MSQIVTRKGPVGEDKEKAPATDTPVKEMKKKMAANAEKEKQAAERHTEKEKEKDKPTETKPSEKGEKNVEKNSEKKEKPEKSSEKKEKPAEKEKVDKSAEKKSEAPTPADKPKEDKNAKPEKSNDKDKDAKEKERKPAESPKPKTNGVAPPPHAPAAAANGSPSDGTVSSDEEDVFPELAYEDSDGEFEPPTPEGLPSRSYTRRSQAKAARTPETPRPASDRRADRDADDSKESKVLKLKEDTPSTDRKLRSSDSPKPEGKREKKAGEKEREVAKEADTTKTDKPSPSPKNKDLEVPEVNDDGSSTVVEVTIDVDMDEGAARKDGTNYSRSRVKVSPYRRADHTASSVAANYTGNNTTMEMDITESSSFAEESPAGAAAGAPGADSPYLSGLRAIRGRRSYKPLREMAVRNIAVTRSARAAAGGGGGGAVAEPPHRPTAPVVGRKRRPEGEGPAEPAGGAGDAGARGKRARLLDKLARPFRTAASTPLPVRRNAEIVGINTDLPLTAPVAAPDTFDPESLKTAPAPTAAPASAPAPPGLAPGALHHRDNKRCSVM